jgi:hypothetical protein
VAVSGEFPEGHPLRPAYLEFLQADAAYEKMVKLEFSGGFQEFDAAWREFLRRIDRVWKKARAAARGKPGWQTMESRVAHLRKTDPFPSAFIGTVEFVCSEPFSAVSAAASSPTP